MLVSHGWTGDDDGWREWRRVEQSETRDLRWSYNQGLGELKEVMAFKKAGQVMQGDLSIHFRVLKKYPGVEILPDGVPFSRPMT